MNLPNKLTIARIILTFIFMALLSLKGIGMKAAALVIFIIASLTDYYDGRIARGRNEITDFGKIMDPIADKILTLGAFVIFVEQKLVPAWMVVIIISRELVVTGVRLFFARKGGVLAAEWSGKHKTFFQMLTIFYILVIVIVREVFRMAAPLPLDYEFWLFQVILYVLMIITVTLTLCSGLLFLKRNIRGA